MSFEGVVTKQESTGMYILRFLTNLKKIGQENLTTEVYETRLELLERYWEKFQERNDDLMDYKEYHSSEYCREDLFSKVEEAYMTTKAHLRQQIRQLSTPAGGTRDAGRGPVTTARLPKLSLPTFSGDYLMWENFRDLFLSVVHAAPELSNAAKLQYLRSLLLGEAAKLLANVPITDANYEGAWASLVERYDDKRLLMSHHFNHLLSLKALTTESAPNLKKLFDTTSESRRALENLGRPVQHWDDWFVHLTVQKLDPITRKDWETQMGSRKQIPTYAELSEFLVGRIRAMDAVASPPRPLPPTASRGREAPSSALRAHTSRAQASVSPTASKNCPLCEGKHYIGYCADFKQKSPQQRKELAERLNLCFNCLRDHQANSCPSLKRCIECEARHHTLLHSDAGGCSGSSRPISSAHAKTSLTGVRQPTLLATAMVRVTAPTGRSATVRALLDQGSEATFISEDLTQRLRLSRTKVCIPVTGMGAAHCGTVKALVHVQLSSELEGYSTTINAAAFVLPNLLKTFHPLQIKSNSWSHLENLMLSDAEACSQARIDLVIGADLYGYTLLDGLVKGDPGSPVAQHTIFGWVLSGRVEKPFLSGKSALTNLHCSVDLSLMDELRKFWELEEVIQNRPWTPEEQYCEEQFRSTHSRTSEGRFVVRLPRCSSAILGSSRATALRALHHNEARRQKDEALNQAYQDFMKEYQQLGHMTLTGAVPETSNQTCYLPHHAVWKSDGASRKIRVVFNASARTTTGRSLNDCLLPGPKLQRDLSQVLLRWRKHRIVFSADIVKMFRQIWVHPDDQSLQQILWRDSPQQSVQEFKLQTVTYGTACAPFLAIRCLQQLATDEAGRFPDAAEVVRSQMYVDDVLSGADTLERALSLKEQLQGLLMAGGFQLAKWSSNSPQLAGDTNSAQCLSDGSVKTLGLHWNPDTDAFGFRVQLENPGRLSKRSILSCIAKLFDPLGWLAPVLIVAKLFIQDLWTSKTDWDDELPCSVQEAWVNYYQSLEHLQQVHLPRWISSEAGSPWELHGFCDASQRAYAAAVYIRVRNEDDKSYRATLLAAKTKVAPVKVLSLPRLELCGAVLLVKLIKNVREIFQDAPKVYAWTDSQVTLCWLREHPSRWKCFVANRTSEIHRLAPDVIWNHVPSEENAADPASRGISVSTLLTSRLWWEGPTWLSQPKSCWPNVVHLEPRPCVQEEEASNRNVFTTGLLPNNPSWPLQERYSSLRRLLRITSWLFRFGHNSRKPQSERFIGPITTQELNCSRDFWIRLIQREHLPCEIKNLEAKAEIQKGSPLFRLRPFLDEKGLLRVGGRLGNSLLSYDEKHPIIVPAQAAFARLLVRDAHERTLHGGPLLISGFLGTRYWIIRGRNLIRKTVHECLSCFRQSASCSSQQMGQLPAERVTPSRPFLHAGVDYAGPIMLRTSPGRGHKSFKGYIALFVCFSTKAVHLEAVSDLTTEAFLAAFRRFTARRGIPSDLYSDQSTTFRGADAELRALHHQASMASQKLVELLANDGTQWHFIPPRSPHFGGLWEAGVKSVKHHLRRVIGETKLTFEELTTVLTQIEACLNSRPLTPISSCPNDFSALTPGHFLIGTPVRAVPEPSLLEANPNRLQRWRLLQNMQQHFWKRWSMEYLHGLRQFPKWSAERENLKIGDMVLLVDEGLPPTKWHLGRISATHPGPDNLVRVVTVRTSKGEFQRSIVKIAKLPINAA